MESIALTKDNFTALHCEFTEEADGVIRAHKTEKVAEDDTNSLVTMNGFTMKNGIIEVDVKAVLREDAPEWARGFIGIGYHINSNSSEFEGFYIRPTNGRGCTDPYRMAHACQYFAYPGYTWSYLREFNVEGVESAISTIALGEWAHIKAVLKDDTAEFFVNGEQVLSIQKTIHTAIEGRLGFNCHVGTDSYYKNLQIEKRD